MNVAQLKKKLEDFPDHLEVFVGERKTEFTYGLINSVRIESIAFFEDVSDDEPMIDDVEVLVIDEE